MLLNYTLTKEAPLKCVFQQGFLSHIATSKASKCFISFHKSCIVWRKIGVFDSSKTLANRLNTVFLTINFSASGLQDFGPR